MKKKIISLLTIIVLTIFGILIKISFNKEESSLQDNSSKQVVKENLLSMMLETSAGSGEYKMVTQSSWPTNGYIFNAELSKCENGGELGWDSTNKVVTMAGNMSDKCYVYFDKCIPKVSDFCSNGDYLAMCLADYAYNVDSSITNIYYHDGTLENGIDDGSYRYSGASSLVNNYICFGSDDDTCSADNLYRIIGVIGGKVKLIKATSLGNVDWDSNGKNTWSTSSLNTYLNGTYLNTFSEDWQSKIATTTWEVGGIDDIEVTAATMYTNKIDSIVMGTAEFTEYSSKVALMYAHEYGFAASPIAWTTTLDNYDKNDSEGTSIKTNNWLHLGFCEWLVSRYSSDSANSSFVTPSGDVNYGDLVTSSYAVRPVFFLESEATYSDGVGASDNPYRLG